MSDIDGGKNRMAYVEWISAVRMLRRNGLQDELVRKRWLYAVKIQTPHDICLFRPYSSKDVGWNVAYMDPQWARCRVSKLP